MLNNLSDNQKRTLALAAMALLALACLCGTLAFTVDMVPANNVLSFGSVKVRVCEYTLNEQGEEVPFEADEHGDYPDTKAGGSDISRIVRVENAGAQPEYVRARLRMTSVASDGSTADASDNVAFNVNAGEGFPWIDGGDGWYYYRGLAGRGGMLDPGAMTESLMDSLRFVGDYNDAARWLIQTRYRRSGRAGQKPTGKRYRPRRARRRGLAGGELAHEDQEQKPRCA